MDMVLRRLLDGVRRLIDEWEAKERSGDGDATVGSRQAFGRTAQVLNKFQSAFLRASWKRGCELLFPILYRHMSFQTHRCWQVLMRKATWLAAEAWR